ncbi:MAG TPA: hypothetical protein VE998_07010, partial [Terriglobales bacterium]|nr:hypothetical protein [Terriglobales bacterium]
MNTKLKALLVVLASALLAACSSSKPAASTSEPPPKKETQQVTGREGFQKLYVTARAWSADAQPFILESGVTKDAPGHDGKAA